MIDGRTKLAGVMASPIKHSISPFIHNLAFQELGINSVYLAFEVQPEKLCDGITAIRTLDMYGVNLSMPHKQEALKYVDELSEASELLGAINTIVLKNNRLIGYNTDGEGFMQSIRDQNIDMRQKKMTLLGAGGAARAILVQAALDGVKEIAVFNRNIENLKEINKISEKLKNRVNCKIETYSILDEKQLSRHIQESCLLVNATSVGMGEGNNQTLINDTKLLRSDLAVADIIYEPKETRLLKEARENGAQTVNGLGMLVHQAAQAFELWTGEKMPVEKIIKQIQ